MKTDIVISLTPEKEVTNNWFDASFVRQPDGRLLAHIKYHKWSSTAKKKTKEVMDSFDEPLYIFVHDTYHLKYITSLGFTLTGRFVTCPFPGKEGLLFPEGIYIKEGAAAYSLQAYQEVGEFVLPLEAVDGYGKIEEVEARLAKYPSASYITKHHFSDNVYTRETFVQKDAILTGHRHKQETISILVSGVISVIVVDELGRAEDKGVLVAPAIFTTKPNIKKIGFAHEDTVFINSFSIAELPKELHNEANIEIIENYIFDKREILCLE